MECPKCHLQNPAIAVRCDCGYDFTTGTLERSYLEDREGSGGLSSPVRELASLEERLVGWLVDRLVVGGAILPHLVLRSVSEEWGNATMAFGVVAAVSYALFADGIGNGQSIGKRVSRTRVVDAVNGEPCSVTQSFIRHFVQCLGVLDWAFVFGERRQRLGDRAANTLVIKAS